MMNRQTMQAVSQTYSNKSHLIPHGWRQHLVLSKWRDEQCPWPAGQGQRIEFHSPTALRALNVMYCAAWTVCSAHNVTSSRSD